MPPYPAVWRIRKIDLKPKILFLDIETLPNLGWTWGRYEQNVIAFYQESCIASFAAKWQGKKQAFGLSLPAFKGYKPHSYDDKKLVQELHKLLGQADIIVAHNGISFDMKVINARFIFHKLDPVPPTKMVDTKREFKKVARFNSNKLDDLGKLLGEGKKIKTDFDLWLGCINGDKTSWKKMLDYNIKDVVLLEKVYNRILPWINTHPNLTLLDSRAACPKCGSPKVQKRGYSYSATRKYQRMQCTSCGGWSKSSQAVKE